MKKFIRQPLVVKKEIILYIGALSVTVDRMSGEVMKRGHFFKTSIPSIPKPVTSDMVFSSIHFRQQDRMDTKLFCEDLIDWNLRYSDLP